MSTEASVLKKHVDMVSGLKIKVSVIFLISSKFIFRLNDYLIYLIVITPYIIDIILIACFLNCVAHTKAFPTNDAILRRTQGVFTDINK